MDESQIKDLCYLSLYWKGSYGWVSGGGSVLVNGNVNEEKDGYNGNNDILENDTIVLTLNLDNNTLTFRNLRNDSEYVLLIPAKTSWRIHVSFQEMSTKIRLSNIKCIKI